MFQNFESTGGPANGAVRLARLRAALAQAGLDGFIVPRADEHQGEYVPPSAERLAWLTGFTGSAGTAIVLRDKAAVFVDGRYTLQVRAQVDLSVFKPVAVAETSPAEWIEDNAEEGARIGYDPWLVTRAQEKRYGKACERAGATLVAVAENPLDAVWEDRPPPPASPVSLQPDELAGCSAAEKIEEARKALERSDADAAVLTDPASIAWIFNIRGRDVPRTPLPLSFAILRRQGRPSLFIASEKLSNAVRDALENLVAVAPPDAFAGALDALGREKARVLYDPQSSAAAVAAAIEAAGGTIVESRDPVALPKARKSAAELDATRAAHARDAVAVTRFLAWLDAQAPGTIGEIDAATALESFRRETAERAGSPLEDLSFDTISSTGPNGAINHYRVTRATDRTLADGDLFLIDSGAQYRDGTTDITRTVLIGAPSPDRLSLYRDRFTRVLKGHIAIARARFPVGTSGAHLDALARIALWSAGLDFDHGTGHGVGVFLSVHEGPQSLSKRGQTPLEPGMILSNEPGYYVADDFGIRIENLIVVREAKPVPGGDRPMLSFETISFAPIDRRLIAPTLLDTAELAWLDAYHQRVRGVASASPDLTRDELAWLEAACRPLADEAG